MVVISEFLQGIHVDKNSAKLEQEDAKNPQTCLSLSLLGELSPPLCLSARSGA